MRSEAQPTLTARTKNVPKNARVACKQGMRRAISASFYHCGLFRLTRSLERSYEIFATPLNRIPRLRRSVSSKFGILCYHRVGTEGLPYSSTLDPRLFEAHMRYLKGNYRIVALRQLVREMLGREDVPPTLAITFDDGYRDLYTHAFPVLRQCNIPATIYLIGRCMETGELPWYDRIFAAMVNTPESCVEVLLNGNRLFFLEDYRSRLAAAWEIVCYLRTIPDVARQEWCAEFDHQVSLPRELLDGHMLNWEQVRVMQGAGVAFGAHTMNHPAVSRLYPAAYDYEFVRTKRLLEDGLQSPVEDFAYPFGKAADGNSAVRRYLARAGYRSATTTVEGFNSFGENLFSLRRLQIGEVSPISEFAFGVSRLFLESADANAGIWESPVGCQCTQAAETHGV